MAGAEKFMSQCRARTKVAADRAATIVVSRWQGELDAAKMRGAMAHPAENREPKLP